MSASENLNPRQFYHGTKAKLEPGDLIEPGHKAGWTDTAQKNRMATHVYATTRMDDARYFADQAHSQKPPEYSKAHGMYLQPTGLDERRFVYEVEPTGRMMPDPNERGRIETQGTSQSGYRSKKPLRVKSMLETWNAYGKD